MRAIPRLAPVACAALIVGGLGGSALAAESGHDIPEPVLAAAASRSIPPATIRAIGVEPGLDGSVLAALDLDGVPTEMRLWPHSLRAPRFQVLVPDAQGGVQPVDAPPARTFRGEIVGRPHAGVAASISAGTLHAVVTLEDGSLRAIEPLDGPWHAVYRADDLELADMACGTPSGADADMTSQALPAGAPLFAVADIAFDADYQYYQANGSSIDNTVHRIEQALNHADFIFRRDTGIGYRLTAALVWTSEPDPYYSTDAGDLLEGFQDFWNDFRGGIIRDVAHLMTGKILDGGVAGRAHIGTICEIDEAYGLSKYQESTLHEAILLAHELGHSWDAEHCDGDPDCGIMCSNMTCTLNGVAQFSSAAKSSIIAHRLTRWCLDFVEVPPVPCAADVTGDRAVDVADLMAVLAAWGPCSSCPEDIDDDETVGVSDIIAIVSAWGHCPSGPDLEITNVDVPAIIEAGDSFPVAVTIANTGDYPVDVRHPDGLLLGAWLTLDGDPFRGFDDIPMGGPAGPGGLLPLVLDPGESRVVEFQSLMVPGNARMGPQQFVACIDLGMPPCGGVCETDESNNCRPTSVYVAGPDLVVTNIETDGPIGTGCSFEVGVTITNDGTARALGNVNLGVWLTLDGDPFYGFDDIPMGGPPQCVNLDLDIGESTTVWFTTLQVPPNAAWGPQELVACIDTQVPPCGFVAETNEANNCSTETVIVSGPDAEVVRISAPDEALGGEFITALVTVRNNSCHALAVPVRTTLGPVVVDRWVTLGAGQQTDLAVVIQALASDFDCGAPETLVLRSCTTLDIDEHRSNDCASRTVEVTELYYDLRVEVFCNRERVPLYPCNWNPHLLDWTVRITNVGNASYNGGAMLKTSIEADDDPGNWDWPLDGVWYGHINSIAPGSSRTISIRNYRILCGASPLRQWIKAEIVSGDACGIGWGNNLHNKRIEFYRYP